MRIVFFGTGTYGIPALKGLLASGHDVIAVVTQPDRKKGRGWSVHPTPVKALLVESKSDVTIIQPEDARSSSFIGQLKALSADLFVVIDYGQILSEELLEVPRKYCINLHPSLLPKYRGAAPINWAILRGEKETGNTVFRMNERMDAGDIIAVEKVSIKPFENSVDLAARLASRGVELLNKTLRDIESGKEAFVPQPAAEATFARKLTKDMGRIDWSLSAGSIVRQIHGLQPWPGAYTAIQGKKLKVIEAKEAGPGDKNTAPGTVLNTEEFTVMARDGAIALDKVQIEGRKPMPKEEFLRGQPLQKGAILGEPAA